MIEQTERDRSHFSLTNVMIGCVPVFLFLTSCPVTVSLSQRLVKDHTLKRTFTFMHFYQTFPDHNPTCRVPVVTVYWIG